MHKGRVNLFLFFALAFARFAADAVILAKYWLFAFLRECFSFCGLFPLFQVAAKHI